MKDKRTLCPDCGIPMKKEIVDVKDIVKKRRVSFESIIRHIEPDGDSFVLTNIVLQMMMQELPDELFHFGREKVRITIEAI